VVAVPLLGALLCLGGCSSSPAVKKDVTVEFKKASWASLPAAPRERQVTVEFTPTRSVEVYFVVGGDGERLTEELARTLKRPPGTVETEMVDRPGRVSPGGVRTVELTVPANEPLNVLFWGWSSEPPGTFPVTIKAH
jgi:hypothetical protein